MLIQKAFLLLFRHKAVAKLLIDAGANVNIQEKNGCTAFDMATVIGECDKLCESVHGRRNWPS